MRGRGQRRPAPLRRTAGEIEDGQPREVHPPGARQLQQQVERPLPGAEPQLRRAGVPGRCARLGLEPGFGRPPRSPPGQPASSSGALTRSAAPASPGAAGPAPAKASSPPTRSRAAAAPARGPAAVALLWAPGSSATCRSGQVVPQCAHSQRRASGWSGPRRSTSSGTGTRRCRSSGHPPGSPLPSPPRARLRRSRRRSTASRSWPARMRAPWRLIERRCGSGGRREQVEPVLLARARGRRARGSRPVRRAAWRNSGDQVGVAGDDEVVVQPVRVRQRQDVGVVRHGGAGNDCAAALPCPARAAVTARACGPGCRRAAGRGGRSGAWS